MRIDQMRCNNCGMEVPIARTCPWCVTQHDPLHWAEASLEYAKYVQQQHKEAKDAERAERAGRLILLLVLLFIAWAIFS